MIQFYALPPFFVRIVFIELGEILKTVHDDLLIAEAPREFIATIACLMGDAVAEKAFEVIYQSRREDLR